METYRRGHNGPDSKSGIQQCIVGSNPTVSAKIKKTKKNFVFFIFTVYVGFEQAGSRKSQEFLYFYFATKQSGGLFTASACRAKFILRRANPTVSALFPTRLACGFFIYRLYSPANVCSTLSIKGLFKF